MRKHLLLGLLVAGVCMYFAFRGISFTVLFANLRHADPSWILSALLIYSFGYLFRAYRWKILLEPVVTTTSAQLMGPLLIGFFSNNVLPFRMGEFVRAQVAGHKLKVSRTASLATILLERLYDTVCFLLVFVLVATVLSFPPVIKKGAAVLGVLCLAAALGLWVVSRHQQRFYAWVNQLGLREHWKHRIVGNLQNFLHGTSGTWKVGSVLRILAVSALIWLVEGSFIFLVSCAFHIPITYLQAFFVLFFTGLSVTIPQAPGFVGTYEAFGTMALTLLSIPKESGLAVILAIHGLQFLFVGIGGLAALSMERLSWHQLFSLASVKAEPA